MRALTRNHRRPGDVMMSMLLMLITSRFVVRPNYTLAVPIYISAEKTSTGEVEESRREGRQAVAHKLCEEFERRVQLPRERKKSGIAFFQRKIEKPAREESRGRIRMREGGCGKEREDDRERERERSEDIESRGVGDSHDGRTEI